MMNCDFLGRSLGVFLLVSCASSSGVSYDGASYDDMPELPEGGAGIASKYAGDEGIENDSDVILADNFESYSGIADLGKKWSGFFNGEFITISGGAYSGEKALYFFLPKSNDEIGAGVFRILSPEEEQDQIFFRYYSKYDSDFDVMGSSHNGASVSSKYYSNGNATPGIPANGKNKFLAGYENWRDDWGSGEITPNPGLMNVYLYHPKQRSEWGDHLFPPGYVSPNTSLPFDFGPQFVPRPDVVPELDRWYCYEFMVKANTPGRLDGRIACWLDGELIADFTNLRLRDTESLKIDRLDFSLHIKNNTNSATGKYYDNIVIAKSYIGPVNQAPNK